MIGFPRGGAGFARIFCDRVRPEGFGCDWGTNLPGVREALGGEQVLQGNLDPLCLLNGGEALDWEVDRIVGETSADRHIFNLGHGIVPETPISHVEQMLARLRVAEMSSE